jgi:hypothetical protein
MLLTDIISYTFQYSGLLWASQKWGMATMQRNNTDCHALVHVMTIIRFILHNIHLSMTVRLSEMLYEP